MISAERRFSASARILSEARSLAAVAQTSPSR